MANRICSLCGTYYTDKKGHPLEDCWGILHQRFVQAQGRVMDLEYKLKQARERINKAKAEASD